MRRRRRFKGTWLPNIGIINATNPLTAPTAGREMVIGIGGGSTIVGGVLPLIFDAPQEPDAWVERETPLSYLAANEYTIRRIVGKCFVATAAAAFDPTTTNYNNNPPQVLVTSGLFIARAGDDDSTTDTNDLPIGWTSQGTLSYNPDIPDSIREPWIWRRQWILSNVAVKRAMWQDLTVLPPPASQIAFDSPSTNWELGSMADGPHLDAKTRRRIGNDDRLWWCVFAQPYPRGGYTAEVDVYARLDYRVFGALRKARNRGNF